MEIVKIGRETSVGRRQLSIVLALVMVSMILALIPSAMAGDQTGARTLEENPGAPVDYVWVLICGFLVMFMQPGFAMLEAGFSRAKNVTC